MTPTKINLVFFWLIQIPLCYVLAVEMNWGTRRRILGRVRLGNSGRTVYAVAVYPWRMEVTSRVTRNHHGTRISFPFT